MSTEKTHIVRIIFDAIKERMGFTKDTELAEWLDVKKQTMSAWEVRGRIANYDPFTQRGLNEYWLRTGIGPMFENDRDEPAFLRRARIDGSAQDPAPTGTQKQGDLVPPDPLAFLAPRHRRVIEEMMKMSEEEQQIFLKKLMEENVDKGRY